MVGPNLNLARIPQSGKNHDFLSGEDPYLGYILSKEAVNGIHSQGVMAVARSFSNDNFNQDFYIADQIIDEKTRFEMYYPPFEGAIEANIQSIMCSKAKVNGEYAC